MNNLYFFAWYTFLFEGFYILWLARKKLQCSPLTYKTLWVSFVFFAVYFIVYNETMFEWVKYHCIVPVRNGMLKYRLQNLDYFGCEQSLSGNSIFVIVSLIVNIDTQSLATRKSWSLSIYLMDIIPVHYWVLLCFLIHLRDAVQNLQHIRTSQAFVV